VGARKGKKRNSVYIWTACIKTKAYKSLNMFKYSLAISLYYGGKSNEFVRF